jgi:hypothetical protein
LSYSRPRFLRFKAALAPEPRHRGSHSASQPQILKASRSGGSPPLITTQVAGRQPQHFPSGFGAEIAAERIGVGVFAHQLTSSIIGVLRRRFPEFWIARPPAGVESFFANLSAQEACQLNRCRSQSAPPACDQAAAAFPPSPMSTCAKLAHTGSGNQMAELSSYPPQRVPFALLWNSLRRYRLRPRLERFCSESLQSAAARHVALRVKCVADGVVTGQKSLR